MFDRRKFKGTSVNDLDTPAQEGGALVKADFLKHNDGDNFYRILPSVNAVKIMAGQDVPEEKYITPQALLFVPLPETDAQGFPPKFPNRIANSFNLNSGKVAVVHSAITHGGVRKDLIREYYYALDKKLKENIDLNKDVIANSKNLFYEERYMMYVYRYKDIERDDKEFGIIAFSRGQYEDFKKLASTVATEEVPDPFSNPDVGLLLRVTKDPNQIKVKNWNGVYTVGFATKGIEPIKKPLTDNDLTFMLSQDSLYGVYSKCFSPGDLAKQISFLKYFDQSCGFKILETPAFKEICEKIYNQFNFSDVGVAPVTPDAPSGVDSTGGSVEPPVPPVSSNPTPAPAPTPAPVNDVVAAIHNRTVQERDQDVGDNIVPADKIADTDDDFLG